MAKQRLNTRVKMKWLGMTNIFGSIRKLEEIIPEYTILLIQSGKRYMPQLVIERTEDKIVSVGICELEPCNLYKQSYKIIKPQRGFWLEMLDGNLINKDSEEDKKYREVLSEI